jgi:beta-lactamase regulating signal transducer with metallopeptidase domain
MLTSLFLSNTPPWFVWSVEIACRGALLLLVACLASVLWRRASAAQLHLLWTAAVVGILLLPLLSVVCPAWRVVRLPEWRPLVAIMSAPTTPSNTNLSSTASSPTSEPIPVAFSHDIPAPAESASASAASVRSQPLMPGLPWHNWAAIAWGGGALLLLAWWVYGYAATARLLKRAKPAPADWHHLPAELGTQKARLLMSEEIGMPAVTGLFRPALLLPSEAASWPAERLRVVLLHELAHIRRGDMLTQLLTQLACALYWVNPLVWLAAHRLRVEREAACDDAVLAAEIKASDYAAHLLAISSIQLHRPVAVGGIAMARSSRIGSRLNYLLDVRRNRRKVTRLGLLILVIIAIPFLVVFAVAQMADKESGNTSNNPPVNHTIPRETPMAVEGPGYTGNNPPVYIAFYRRMTASMPRSYSFGLPDGSPHPVISPDGSRILFVANTGWPIGGKEAEGDEAYQYHRETGGVENLRMVGRSMGRFGWNNPDLAYKVSWDGKVKADGKDPDAVVSPDGRIAATFEFKRAPVKPDSPLYQCYLIIIDRQTGARKRIEVPGVDDAATGGARLLSNLQSSQDGRFFAFEAVYGKRWGIPRVHSASSWQEVMVYDRITDELKYANVNENGEHVSVGCRLFGISADGRYVLFRAWPQSFGSQQPAEEREWAKKQRLFADDTYPEGGYYLYETKPGKVRRYREWIEAVTAVRTWFYPFTSEDCRFIVSEEGEQDGPKKIVLTDVKTGEIVTVSDGGKVSQEQLGLPDASHVQPTISRDGRYISYFTRLSNQSSRVSGDPDWQQKVHLAQAIQVYDRETRKTSTVLLATDLPQPPAGEKTAVKDEAVDPIERIFPAVPDSTVALHASLLAENGSVTAYEPVLIRVEELNKTAKAVSMIAGTITDWTARVLVEDAEGRQIAASPRSRLPVDITFSGKQLKPGESRVRMLAVSAIYPFARPGNYTVRVQRLKLSDDIVVLAEDRVPVRVLPFDAARLKARCEESFTYSKDFSAHGDLSNHDQTRALFSVRHDIALPYIDWHARSDWSTAFEAWIALRLIGSPRAIAELDTLAAREGKKGKAVREFKDMSLDQLVWSILGDYE